MKRNIFKNPSDPPFTCPGLWKDFFSRPFTHDRVPRNDPEEVEPVEVVLGGLGVSEPVDFQYSRSNQKLLVRLRDEEEVRRLRPRFSDLLEVENALGWRRVIVTAKRTDPYDFVSRYFAPWMGVDEDPVTGSAHTVLAPYWAKVLGKNIFRAYQA